MAVELKLLPGLAVGTFAALGLTRWIRSLLYEVAATDPLTFALTPLCLLAAALPACYLPARRATQIDPLVARRSE